MLTIHLDEATEHRLLKACRELGCSESEAIKQSLEEWLKRLQQPPNAYELGEDLFDQGESVEPLEDQRRRQIWDYLNAKHRHR